ncbi:family 20 glycosylhydrolase [Fibrobacterota bacterium]
MNFISPKYIGAMALLFAVFAVDVFAATDFVPRPNSMTLSGETFTVPEEVNVFSDGPISDSTAPWAIKLFQAANKTATLVGSAAAAHVVITQVTDASLESEGYRLTITANLITIEAQTSTGQFYALMTIRQMMPPEIERSPSLVPGVVALEGLTITDKPRYSWRGTMLDPARRFIPLEYIRETIDRMALFKLNRLHIHLTDDQGWRMEIIPPADADATWRDAYLNLIEIGASSQIFGGDFDGYFYTQDELRDLVTYAKLRKVELVPEIDQPGHTHAAIHSFYMSGIVIGTSGWGVDEYMTSGQVGQSLLDVNNGITPEVDDFLVHVFTEVAKIFPYEFIHVGGDEAHNVTEAGYLRTIRRAEEIVNGLGRKMTGWSEVVETDRDGQPNSLNPTSMGQDWHGSCDVPNSVFSCCRFLYLDMPQREGMPNTLNWCTDEVNLRTLYDSYSYMDETRVGIEAPNWGEYSVMEEGVPDRNLFPRLTGVAELGWSLQSHYNWNEYRARVAPFGERFDLMGMSWFRGEDLVEWVYGDEFDDDMNAFQNFEPVITPVKVDAPPRQISKKRVGPAQEFKVFDLKGQEIHLSGNQDLENVKKTNLKSGLYLVVEDGEVQKVLK